jgi:hypothetical protein
LTPGGTAPPTAELRSIDQGELRSIDQYILRPFLPRGYRPPTAELRSIDQGELRSIDQYIPVHSYLRSISTAEAPGWFYLD